MSDANLLEIRDLCVEFATERGRLKALRNVGHAAGNFAGNEGLAAALRFVVEQNAVAGIHAVGLAVVDRDPVGVKFGHAIRAAWVKRCSFFLGASVNV